MCFEIILTADPTITPSARTELRLNKTRIPNRAFHSAPECRGKVRRPPVKWKSTIAKELVKIKMTWGEARAKAKDRFCSTSSE
ncbi:hypothetical protein BpHYR1_046758 [Brachionus plicatilis]|uniref:Uncharacterized protein n=1 Tax=Brachionus plicatilis TaxID=10195 RepID=A0A3M7PFB9_BRAPC|nr:hypothetical protein BpHYR1_046758 [Brachionus plicatilis]